MCTGNLSRELKDEILFCISVRSFISKLSGDKIDVKELMKDETLVEIAKELVDTVNNNMAIGWDIIKDARARMRIEIKKLLIKYSYSLNKSEKALQTVITQAKLKCKEMIN